jgi:transcriptional regulator GlxA family with amidase domain
MASSDPIEAIARRTGFASVRTLRHQFQQTVGMSPTVFRSQGVVSASDRLPSKRLPP